MTGSAAYSAELQTSGGFRIEISLDVLTVTEATSTQNILWIYLTYALIFCAVLVSVGRSSLFLLLVFLAAGILRYLFVGVHNLRCTRESLEVIDIFPGRPTRTRFYKRCDVGEIGFGAVSFSKYGTTGGLIFEVSGKRIKMLYGLRCIEAQKVLLALHHLGFDVCRDPGMPMMIELEESRRKSWFGRLLT